MPTRRKVVKRHVVKHHAVKRHVRRPKTSAVTRAARRLWVVSKAADKRLSAKRPGKRPATKTHKTYYEYRANRSDRNARTRL
jgi:hypothetical protein